MTARRALALGILLWAALLHPATAAQLVLIIDDIGDNLALGRRAADLPGAVALAVLPHTPHGHYLAQRAHRHGKDILLHLPMSNHGGRDPGPGALNAAMDRAGFAATLAAGLDGVPHVRGVNNHMGSELTELPRQMSWLMRELQRRQLYFVDSRTTPHTAAERQARLHGLPHLRRHVFLDHKRCPRHIAERFEMLVEHARQTGLAVGIGHPYPETLALLERRLPGLMLRGVTLVSPSQLLTPPPPDCAPAQWACL